MHFDIDRHTIFLTLAGSHAYGMARPESDVDVRGVCITPKEIVFSFFKNFEQYSTLSLKEPLGENTKTAFNKIAVHPTASHSWDVHQEIDFNVYDITKFFLLAAKNNPNIFELLFVDESDILFQTKEWELIKQNRDLFLSKLTKSTYSGYANSQLAKIERHRGWLLNPPKKEPLRKDYNLPEESVLPANERNLIEENIKKKIREWECEDGIELSGAAQDVFRENLKDFYATLFRNNGYQEDLKTNLHWLAGESLGLSKEVLAAIKSERAYRSAREHWKQYLKWKEGRNRARAELETKYGYDSKHASHLIRLLRTGLEILRDRTVYVRRTDAQELLAIRNGEFTYEQLIEHANGLKNQLSEAYKQSTLPKKPDLEAIDELLLRIYHDNV